MYALESIVSQCKANGYVFDFAHPSELSSLIVFHDSTLVDVLTAGIPLLEALACKPFPAVQTHHHVAIAWLHFLLTRFADNSSIDSAIYSHVKQSLKHAFFGLAKLLLFYFDERFSHFQTMSEDTSMLTSLDESIIQLTKNLVSQESSLFDMASPSQLAVLCCDLTLSTIYACCLGKQYGTLSLVEMFQQYGTRALESYERWFVVRKPLFAKGVRLILDFTAYLIEKSEQSSSAENALEDIRKAQLASVGIAEVLPSSAASAETYVSEDAARMAASVSTILRSLIFALIQDPRYTLSQQDAFVSHFKACLDFVSNDDNLEAPSNYPCACLLFLLHEAVEKTSKSIAIAAAEMAPTILTKCPAPAGRRIQKSNDLYETFLQQVAPRTRHMDWKYALVEYCVAIWMRHLASVVSPAAAIDKFTKLVETLTLSIDDSSRTIDAMSCAIVASLFSNAFQSDLAYFMAENRVSRHFDSFERVVLDFAQRINAEGLLLLLACLCSQFRRWKDLFHLFPATILPEFRNFVSSFLVDHWDKVSVDALSAMHREQGAFAAFVALFPSAQVSVLRKSVENAGHLKDYFAVFIGPVSSAPSVLEFWHFLLDLDGQHDKQVHAFVCETLAPYLTERPSVTDLLLDAAISKLFVRPSNEHIVRFIVELMSAPCCTAQPDVCIHAVRRAWERLQILVLRSESDVITLLSPLLVLKIIPKQGFAHYRSQHSSEYAELASYLMSLAGDETQPHSRRVALQILALCSSGPEDELTSELLSLPLVSQPLSHLRSHLYFGCQLMSFHPTFVPRSWFDQVFDRFVTTALLPSTAGEDRAAFADTLSLCCAVELQFLNPAFQHCLTTVLFYPYNSQQHQLRELSGAIAIRSLQIWAASASATPTSVSHEPILTFHIELVRSIIERLSPISTLASRSDRSIVSASALSMDVAFHLCYYVLHLKDTRLTRSLGKLPESRALFEFCLDLLRASYLPAEPLFTAVRTAAAKLFGVLAGAVELDAKGDVEAQKVLFHVATMDPDASVRQIAEGLVRSVQGN